MSKNTDPSIFKELFTTEIYSIPDSSVNTVSTPPSIVEEEQIFLSTYTGDGSSGVALFTSEKPTSTENEFLEKVLSSINLNLASTALFIDDPANALNTLKKLKIQKVITFGVAFNFIDDFALISSVSLTQLIDQVSEKRKLWADLKSNF